MLAYEPVLNAAKEYAGDPVPFLYAVVLRLFLTLVTIFASMGLLLSLAFVLSYAGQLYTYGLPIAAVLSAFLAIAFLYLYAGFKGSMVKSIMTAEGGSVHMRNFLTYAFSGAPRFSPILFAELLLLALFNAPILGIIFFLKIELLSLPGIILSLIGLVLGLAVRFFFSFAYVSAATKDFPPIASLRNSVRFVLKNPLPSIVLNVAKWVVELMLLVPLLNVLVLVSLYPTLYVLMVNVYKAKGF